MNLLDIDIKDNIQDIIDAFTKVYGVEYKEIIAERINKICYFIYNNTQGIQDYIFYLERNKYNTKDIKEYQEYLAREKERKTKLEEEIKARLQEQIKNLIPKDIENTEPILNMQLGMKQRVEYFSIEDEAKLNDPSISKFDKERIYWHRVKYFIEIGVVKDEKEQEFGKMEEYYKNILNTEVLQKFVPSQEVIAKITQLRTKAYEELEREFIYRSEDFKINAKKFSNMNENKEAIYEIMKAQSRRMDCGSSSTGLTPIVFLTINRGDGGKLDYILLHEICHAIEANEKSNGYTIGFETSIEKNPYNSIKRKYEILNEAITDIFAIEARQALYAKGKYILEPRELINEDVRDYNTYGIVMNLLSTFLDEYREHIIKARLNGDMNVLYEVIGKENFEELNDVINKVDYLSRLGLQMKLTENENNNSIVMEYYSQCERLKLIYEKMKNHYSKRFSNKQIEQESIMENDIDMAH